MNWAMHTPSKRGGCRLVVARQECRLSVFSWESGLLHEILVRIFCKNPLQPNELNMLES